MLRIVFVTLSLLSLGGPASAGTQHVDEKDLCEDTGFLYRALTKNTKSTYIGGGGDDAFRIDTVDEFLRDGQMSNGLPEKTEFICHQPHDFSSIGTPAKPSPDACCH